MLVTIGRFLNSDDSSTGHVQVVDNANLAKIHNWQELEKLRHRFNVSNTNRNREKGLVVKNCSMLLDRSNCSWNKRGFLIDPFSVKHLIQNTKLCKDRDIRVLIVIYSSVENYIKRKRIRQTWGDRNHQANKRTAFLFLLAKSTNYNISDSALLGESQLYGDIIQLDMTENIPNLTYKGLCALKWIKDNCNHVEYIVKTEDFFLVNTLAVYKEINKIHPFGFNDSNSLGIQCQIQKHSLVMRTGKWAVDNDHYTSSYYPPYCLGTGYIMTYNAMLSVYNASFQASFLPVDDIFMTGILPYLAGNIQFHDMQYHHLHNQKDTDIVVNFLSATLDKYMFLHGGSRDKDFEVVWDQIQRTKNQVDNTSFSGLIFVFYLLLIVLFAFRKILEVVCKILK